MEDKHTPGPWEVGGGEKGGEPGFVYCNNTLGSAVAIVFGDALRYSVFPRAEERANARLIAAAPDLLAAAKDALAGWRYIRATHGELYGVGWDRVEQSLTAAISRASR